MAGKGAEFYVLCWVELAGLLLKHLLADIFQLRKEFLVLLSDVSREFPDKPKIVHNQPCLLSVDSKSDDGLDCERQWPVRLNSATAAADSSRSFCRCFRPCSKSSRIYAARMCSPFSENHHDPSGAFFPVYLLLISRHPCTLKKSCRLFPPRLTEASQPQWTRAAHRQPPTGVQCAVEPTRRFPYASLLAGLQARGAIFVCSWNGG